MWSPDPSVLPEIKVNIFIQALTGLAVVGGIIISILLYYHKQSPAVWTTFGIIVAVSLIFCLKWQNSIWKNRETPTNTTEQVGIYRSSQPTLEPFKNGTFGILVGAFKGSTKAKQDKGKEVQSTIKVTLNARFHELDIHDAEAREIPTSIISESFSHDEAREIGTKYKAEIVIFGDITLAGVIPKLTFVNPNSFMFIIKQADLTLMKDELSHKALSDLIDMRCPALTDEPTLLVSFITALKYYRKAKYENSLDYFNASLPKYPLRHIDSAPILFFMGNAYFHINKLDSAIDNYTKAIELNPKIVEAYNNRGHIYSEKGYFDQAISDFTKALEINPNYPEAYFNRGNTYQKIERYDFSISDYKEFLKIIPNHAEAY
jgi:hypothetical protein